MKAEDKYIQGLADIGCGMSETSIGIGNQAQPSTNGHVDGRVNGQVEGRPPGRADGRPRGPFAPTGRLDGLVPHLIRSQLLRPGFVRMSLRLGAARQMPAWAKLQFLNAGVDRKDLDRVLGRITSLESWADAWERLGSDHENAGALSEARGDRRAAAASYLAGSGPCTLPHSARL